MSKKLRGNMMLFLAALIWGVSFVAQKAGMEYVGPFTFNGIRFLIGSLVLVPIILIISRIQKKKTPDFCADGTTNSYENKKDLITGSLTCGLVLFIAVTLQQIGMLYTTAGKTGFITALYIVLVPILGLFRGKRARPILWICVGISTIGLYLLCVKSNFSVSKGDFLVVASAFGFAMHILSIDHFAPKADSIKLSCLQFLVAGLLSIPFIAVFERIDWANVFACWQPILYSAVLSCGVAYTLQIIAQKDTEPTVTSLILSLESVFAVTAGILLLNEQITSRELIGCVIMFSAILLAQLPSKERELAGAENRRPKIRNSNKKPIGNFLP
ncbi:MAG: DMT family transporter [Eubacteriales bacterium]|nr:DMT family transporter [Eubacteriales bacterium]